MGKVFPSQVVEYIKNYRSELGATFQNHINNSKIEVTQRNVGYFSALLRLISEIPNELITIHGGDYTNFVLAIESIKIALDNFSLNKNSYVFAVNENNVISIIEDNLKKLSDTVIENVTNELSFIKDSLLRESIREDISNVENSIRNGNWKAATVMSVSACEALLLWVIEEEFTDFNTNKKGFGSLIGKLEKEEKKIILERNTIDVAKQVKDYRNLIHPEKAKRTNKKCDRAAALLSLSCILKIINDLTKYLKGK